MVNADPEGCAACGMSTNPENAYRNGTMYSSYTAASFARKYLLADEYKVNLTGAVPGHLNLKTSHGLPVSGIWQPTELINLC